MSERTARGRHDERRAGSGPFFHGTKADLKPGDLIRPGYRPNYGEHKVANFLDATASMDAATWGAELALGHCPGRIYQVEPVGDVENDPNLTDQSLPGNPNRSYRTRDPLRAVAVTEIRQPHVPEVFQHMPDHLAELKRQGIEAVNE